LATSCWTKSLFCKYAFYQGFRYSEVCQKILHSLQDRKIWFPASRLDDVSSRPDDVHTVWTHIKLKHHLSGRRGFPSGPSSMSRSFKLLQLASVWTIQQPVRTTLSVRSSFRISFQTQIWEDYCSRLEDVDSRPDALIHKASIAIQVQTTVSMVRTRVHQIWKLRASD